MDPLDQPATASRLRYLYRQQVLDGAAYERALGLAGITPDGLAWRRFLDWLLAGLGAVLVLAGVVFFFAYNWADMPRFGKFAVLEVALLVVVFIAWRLGTDSHGGRAALIGAAVLPGVLLAVYGQIYQTGADPYALFLTWALLISPWVLIGRSAPLWMLLLVLADLAVTLYWTGVYRPPMWGGLAGELGPLYWLEFAFADPDLSWIMVGINLVALALYEVATSRCEWLSGRWMPRVIALAVLGALIVPVMRAILESHPETLSVRLAPLGWMVVTAAGGTYYRLVRHDLFMLAALLLTAIVIVTTFLGHEMPSRSEAGFLLLSLLVVAMTSGAAFWLRLTARQWEEQA
jgi:uncharacterized membrane protein